ncbi:MAG TPA: hypothetical protein VHX88_03235 [Solirubrobacteraceae bacterium]|nr:hypothetical protein [Solirubrobacteraceae bacterium]
MIRSAAYALLLVAAVVLVAAAAAGATSIRVVRCPTGYGVSQPTKRLPATSGSPLGAAQAAGLSYYGNNLLLVLSPAGWHCSGLVGADGSAGMRITHGADSVSVQSVGYTSGVGASEACSLFSDANPPAPCQAHPPAAEHITRRSRTTVEFEDPPHVHGTGASSGGALPANGVMLFDPSERSGFFFEETCVLPAAQHARCTALLDDAIRRAPG